ncbi:MAG TPA: iron-sulfur cluster carrier protein ApbC [Gammaproteobacteria bacterium]|nr:iron-sulfur cluster carrier protein ApbC [Gammaproteobacteria bacterium]
MSFTPGDVENTLRAYIDPSLQCDLVTAKAIRKIKIDKNQIIVDVCLGFPLKTIEAKWKADIQAYLKNAYPNCEITIQLTIQIETHVGQSAVKALPNIKNIIAVGSGKGGVGKSTIAANLALALAQEGGRVGLLDADIYGPSQPTMLNLKGRPEIKDKKVIVPMEQYGIKVMSMGFLVEDTAAIVWRGPMIAMALQQLLNDTLWGELDYLVIDLPPGTGDIQLTLCQKIPVSGAVIVTTPQELALKDVRRAVAMFQKLDVPILGIVENMTAHVCSHCGHKDAIFGQGGAERLAQEFKAIVLSSFPLDYQIGLDTDEGMPSVIKEPMGVYSQQYQQLARLTAGQLSLRNKSYSHKFPQIKVE